MSAPEVSIEKGIATIRTEAFTFCSDTPTPGLSRINFDDGLALETRYAQMGKLSESLAVHEKRHINSSKDESEVSFSMKAVIPFGAEPAVIREVAISDSAIRFTTEVKMRNSFALDKLSAEAISLSGPIGRIAIVKAPTKKADFPEPEWLDFASFDTIELAEPPLTVIIESASKSYLELSFSEDLWRWASAIRHSGSCRFILRREGAILRFYKDLFIIKPETEPVKGWNWRLNWYAAWSKAKPAKSRKRKFKSVFDMEDFEWPESAFCVVNGKRSKIPCMSSQAVLNALKRWLRSQLATLSKDDTLALVNVEAAYCESASHQDRPKFGSLPHWGLGPLIDFHEWAKRQLGPSGANLIIIPKASSEAAILPSLARLR